MKIWVGFDVRPDIHTVNKNWHYSFLAKQDDFCVGSYGCGGSVNESIDNLIWRLQRIMGEENVRIEETICIQELQEDKGTKT